MSMRSELIAYLKANLGPEDFKAYHPAPADVTALPALVLHPGNPYRVPMRIGGTDPAYIDYQLVIEVVVNKAMSDVGLDQLETLLDKVFKLLRSFTGVSGGGVPRWDADADFDEIDIGGQKHLSAQMSVTVPWPRS